MSDSASWPRVKQIFEAALEREPAARPAFVREACGGDDALRAEVESLLAADGQAGSFVEGSPFAALNASAVAALGRVLKTGDRLGPYEILSSIGAGGMGEVYEARDPRLNRRVAIKILSPDRALDPQARARFEREAKAIAALNHPHICTIYDVGHERGTDFLVMERLEGQTLSARLARGALPIAQALQIAIEMADALDRAHRAGIVHRDLKPGNIMLTREGSKLLDFGLAKARHPGAADATLTTPPLDQTAAGTILGTVQYMAPEQLEGRDADARSDIFAFGAVVYEMLAGKKAFAGSSQASVMSAIMQTEPPPVATLVAETPASLDRTIRKCLAKDPDDRWQSARDLRDELRWLAEQPPTVPPIVPVRSPWFTRLAVPALAAALGIAVMWVVMRPANRASSDAALLNLTLPVPEGVQVVDEGPAVSPDGSRIAFAGIEHGDATSSYLFVRSVFDRAPVRLEDTRGARFPIFSPDGRWIAFFKNRTLVKMPATGGPVSVLGEVTNSGPGEWGEDGFIVFGNTETRRIGLGRISANGGEVEVLTRPDAGAGEGSHGAPTILPRGRGYLYAVTGVTPRGLSFRIVARAPDGTTVPLIADADDPQMLEDGVVLFRRGSVLYAQKLADDRFEMLGEAIPIVNDLQPSSYWRSWSTGGAILAYKPQAPQMRRLVWVRRDATVEPLAAPIRSFGGPILSPAGDRVITEIFEVSGRSDAWIFDITRGSLTRATVDGLSRFPRWTPSGDAFTVSHRRGGGVQDLRLIRADGSGAAETIVRGDSGTWAYSWSADGRTLVYGREDPETLGDVWVKDVERNEARALVRTPGREYGGQLSPNGRWVAYLSDLSGQYELYVTPLEGGARWQVSTNGAREACWARDGSELFFRSGNQMLAVDTAGANPFPARKPRVVFERRWAGGLGGPGWGWYDVAPDGRFLMVDDVESGSVSFTVIQGWRQLLTSKSASGVPVP